MHFSREAPLNIIKGTEARLFLALFLHQCIFPQLWKVESLGRKGWQWLGFYRPRLGSNGGGYVYDLKRGRSRQFQSPRPPPWCSPRRVALQSGLVSNFHSHYQSHFTLFGTELWVMANVQYCLLFRSSSYFKFNQVEGSKSIFLWVMAALVLLYLSVENRFILSHWYFNINTSTY